MNKQARQEEEIEERSAPTGSVAYGAIFKEACDALARPSSALFWSGLAAGLSMGASLVAEGLLASHLPEAPWAPLISKFGYCTGFLIVILGRQQLFTENTLTPMFPLLRDRTWERFLGVMRLWGIVLAANLIGCLAAAWVSSKEVAFDSAVRAQFSEIGRRAMEGSAAAHLVHAIFAGWLIALMVWILPFAESARIWVIVIVSYLVGLGRFNHIVAGATQVFYSGVTGAASWGDIIQNYLAPTFAGNVIGGVALVAAINHAQVVSGSGRGKDRQMPH